jgi:hypothetical protein
MIYSEERKDLIHVRSSAMLKSMIKDLKEVKVREGYSTFHVGESDADIIDVAIKFLYYNIYPKKVNPREYLWFREAHIDKLIQNED